MKIALIEAEAEHTSINIDLQNKPEWFTSKVTPVGKVRLMLFTNSLRLDSDLFDCFTHTGPCPQLWRPNGSPGRPFFRSRDTH